MASPRIPIDEMLVESGRKLRENETVFNIADLAAKLERTLSALNAVETAEPYPVISLKSNYGLSDIRDVVETTGSGSVTNAVGDGKYVIRTGTTPNSTAALRSVERGRYVSGTLGVPGLGLLTAVLLEGDEVAHWGYFDALDGIGFGEDVTGLFVFRRYEGTETRVYRSDWDDPLDGTGPSGLNIDQLNLDIYRMPFRWYGSGPASFEIAGTGTRTDTILVHVIEAPDGEPIVKDPNLPINITIQNDSNGRDIEIDVYGRQFSILGRYEPNRRISSEYRLAQSVGTTFVPLISFIQKTAYDSVSVKTSGVSILTSGANLVWQIRVGGTINGTFVAPQNIPATETAVNFNITGTTITGGQSLYGGVAVAGQGNSAGATSGDIPDVDLPVGTPITLCARSITGTATVTSVFRAREEW